MSVFEKNYSLKGFAIPYIHTPFDFDHGFPWGRCGQKEMLPVCMFDSLCCDFDLNNVAKLHLLAKYYTNFVYKIKKAQKKKEDHKTIVG